MAASRTAGSGFDADAAFSPSAFAFSPFPSFTELLSGGIAFDHGAPPPPRNDGVAGVPKFKSFLPSPLPLSPLSTPPSIFSPSSFLNLLSPAELLDSPALLHSANLSQSPTTGTIPAQSGWKNAMYSSSDQKAENKQERFNSQSDFSFHSTGQQLFDTDSLLNSAEEDPEPEEEEDDVEEEEEEAVAGKIGGGGGGGELVKSSDGYNWRKYGQKTMKASSNPRSYYKCTHHGCSTRKIVECAADGQLTIVYKNSHTHPKPLPAKRNAGAPPAAEEAAAVTTPPENSSLTFGDDEFAEEDFQPQSKRRKEEGEQSEGTSAATATAAGKAVKEPRVVVQTLSDIDILPDGYRWRKYGQKVVKGNPNPRSYYKCTTQGCSVRKHVERAPQDTRAVLTTYEGRHNHDVPVGRGGGAGRMVPEMAMVPQQQPASAFAGYENSLNAFVASQHGRAPAKVEPRDAEFVDSLLA